MAEARPLDSLKAGLGPPWRPHLGQTPHKFSFEVFVHSLELKPHVRVGSVSVLWTRGSKAASTAESVVSTDGHTTIEEKLCLLCTLFRDDKAQRYDRKLCTFTVVQRPDIKLGRASIDLAEYAEIAPGGDSEPFAVNVQRGGIVVGTLRVSIASRWLKGYRRHGAPARAAGAAGIAADSSSLGSGSLGGGGGLSDDDADDVGGDDGASGSFSAEDSESGGPGSETGLERGHEDDADAPLGPMSLTATPAPRRRSPAGCGTASGGSLFASASGLHLPTRRERSAGSEASHATSHPDTELQSQLAEERATRRVLQAELAAQHAHTSRAGKAQRVARMAELRRTSTTASATGEAARQAEEMQALREQLADAEVRHAAAEEKWRDELGKARREKESAVAELGRVAAEREAELEGRLASVEETFGERLARAEEQKSDISRRLGRTARSKESIISQLEAEKTMLALRSDALENELCEALDAKRRQSEQVSQLTRRVGELEAELREVIASGSACSPPQSPSPTGGSGADASAADGGRDVDVDNVADELLEELSVTASVRDALRDDLAKVEHELVGTKLALAQSEEEQAQLRRLLKASKARQLTLAERMTDLEVRLARSFEESAVAEERIAEAFSSVIRDLEEQLRACRAGAGGDLSHS